MRAWLNTPSCWYLGSYAFRVGFPGWTDLASTPMTSASALIWSPPSSRPAPHQAISIFDPFAGFGTTLRTAEQMGRRAIGFEIDESRVTFARRDLTDPTWMRHVDVRHADWSQVPPFQLSITSPPYMTKQSHEQNPLSGYRTLDGNYVRYLTDLQDIYRGVAGRAAAPDARLVVNVANLHGTRLAWDVGNALAEVLTFEREIVIDWDRPQDWFTQDYCLVFQPRPVK